MRFFCFAIFASLCWASRVDASVVAFYHLADVNDSSGSALNGTAVGSPVFSSGSSTASVDYPVAIDGTQSLFCTNSNYVSLPSGVIPSGSTWSEGIDVYFTSLNPQITATQIFTDIASSTGRLSLLINGGFQVNVPTVGGGQTLTVSSPLKYGRWFRLMATGSGTTYKLLFKDFVNPTVWATIGSGTLSTTYSPGTFSSGRIGVYTGGGFQSYAQLQDFLLTTDYLPNGDDAYITTAKPETLYNTIGASFTNGAACSTSAAAGVLLPIQNKAIANSVNVYNSGSTDQSKAPNAYLFTGLSDAFGGYCTKDWFTGGRGTDITSILQQTFITPTAKCWFIVGGDQVINDYSNCGITVSTSANLDAEINSITAYSPLIHIIMTTPYDTPVFFNNATYTAQVNKVYAAYASAVARGANMAGLVDMWALGEITDTCDAGTHPNYKWYQIQGEAEYALMTASPAARWRSRGLLPFNRSAYFSNH